MTLRCNNTTDFRSVIAFKGNSHCSPALEKKRKKEKRKYRDKRNNHLQKYTTRTNTRSMNHEREIDFRFFICFHSVFYSQANISSREQHFPSFFSPCCAQSTISYYINQTIINLSTRIANARVSFQVDAGRASKIIANRRFVHFAFSLSLFCPFSRRRRRRRYTITIIRLDFFFCLPLK